MKRAIFAAALSLICGASMAAEPRGCAPTEEQEFRAAVAADLTAEDIEQLAHYRFKQKDYRAAGFFASAACALGGGYQCETAALMAAASGITGPSLTRILENIYSFSCERFDSYAVTACKELRKIRAGKLK